MSKECHNRNALDKIKQHIISKYELTKEKVRVFFKSRSLRKYELINAKKYELTRYDRVGKSMS